MKPELRRIVLTVHVISSVGWIGAIAGFLALAVAGFGASSVAVMQAAYLSMEIVNWYAVVPLASIAFASGIVASLGTSWGLVRYYWVVVKIVVTVLCSIILAVHIQPIDSLAAVAAAACGFGPELWGSRLTMVMASGAGLAALVVLTILSIYKPRGMTRYGEALLQARQTIGAAVK